VIWRNSALGDAVTTRGCLRSVTTVRTQGLELAARGTARCASVATGTPRRTEGGEVAAMRFFLARHDRLRLGGRVPGMDALGDVAQNPLQCSNIPSR
jgi:hypothetical protein